MARFIAEKREQDALVSKGDFFMRVGNYAAAQGEYQRALEVGLSGGFAVAPSIGLSNAYVKQGKIANAIAVLSAARTQAMGNVQVFMTYAILNCQAGNWAEAVKAYQAVLPWTGDDPETKSLFNDPFNPANPEPARLEFAARIALAGDRFGYGDDAEAEEQYEAALRIKPLDPLANLGYAYLLVDHGRIAEAKPHFEIAARFGDGQLQARSKFMLYNRYGETIPDKAK